MQDESANAATGNPRRRKLWAVVIAIVVVVLVVWFVVRHDGGQGSSAQGAVPVVTAPAVKGTFIEYQDAPATVAAHARVVVKSQVAGRLLSLHFKGGEKVAKGDLLATLDAAPFKADVALAQGAVARDNTRLESARTTLASYQKLLKQDSISPNKVTDQKNVLAQYEADAKADNARLDDAQRKLDATRITAPIAGRVGLSQVDAGGITTITASNPARIAFALPAPMAGPVLSRLDQGACVPVTIYGQDPGKALATGRLDAASNQVDAATGTVKFRAGVPNADGALLPDAFVTARVPVKRVADAVMVPASAVQQGIKGDFVYVVQKGKAVLTPVTTGPGDGNVSVIAKGLAAGAVVVMEGADRLADGAAVEAQAGKQAPTAEDAGFQCPREAAAAASKH